MIELSQVTLHYAETGRRVLDAVDLRVGEGELVVVTGPTGVGKSSLLGVVAGLVPRFTGGLLAGSVRLDGVDVTGRPPRERAHAVGYVGQDPARGFVTDTVDEELAYGMEQLGLPADTMRRRVEETLDLLGIVDLRHRDLRTLSGGQQQRVAIGSVLTTHPRLLVLDEPTSALDPTAAEEVLATLTRLVHDLGVSVLLAEHRLERVVPFADTVCLLTPDGRLVSGEPGRILATSPVVPPLVELGRVAGWDPLPLSVREARRRAGDLGERLRAVAPVVPADASSGASGAAGASGGEPVLRARGVTVVRGAQAVLREVDLDLAGGRVTALMGRNGSGKSTLLWTLQGHLGRRAGEVRVAGRDPHALATDRRRDTVGLLPQEPGDLLYLETVDAECAAGDGAPGAGVAGAGAGRDGAGRCRALLDELVPGIPGDAHPRDLSEGQRLALALALVLAADPPVLLLDEPTRGLDYAAKRALARTVRDLAARGRAVLVTTHDVEFVTLCADDVVVLAEGEVVSSGPVGRVLAESPAFAPQVTKVLGAPWLRVDQVRDALAVG